MIIVFLSNYYANITKTERVELQYKYFTIPEIPKILVLYTNLSHMISNLPETHLKKYKNKLKMERLQPKNVKTDKYDCVVNFSPLSSSILLCCTNIFIM